MKRFFLIFGVLIASYGCDLLSPHNIRDNNENTGIIADDTVYTVTKDIEPFESMFISTSGYMAAVKKDSADGYVVYMDSVATNEQAALVAYLDSEGRINRLYHNGEMVSITYGSNDKTALTFINDEGKPETIIEIGLGSSKTFTKAGDVLDPYDIFSVATIGKDAVEILTALIKNKKFNTELTLKSITIGEQIAAFKLGNTATAVGLASLAILMANPGSLTIAAILGIIDIANAAINDWQNYVANIYFGTSTPVTGEAVQLTDKHFIISYSIDNAVSYISNFNIGVIIADGLVITKRHHLLKQFIPCTNENGRIIINIENLNKKKGDKLKYRVYLESRSNNAFGTNDNEGIAWDDDWLDYWRYGSVREFEITEPALRITSANQTYATNNSGYNFLFDFDVTASNDIPFDVDEWGVKIYKTFTDKCESTDDIVDSSNTTGRGSNTFSFGVNINGAFMNTDKTPYTPIINHFAVPYVTFDKQSYDLFDNAKKVILEYKEKERPTPGQWVDLGLPSGVLWAGWNVGASRPEEYGGYYAWGETEEKSIYDVYTYKHAYIDDNGYWLDAPHSNFKYSVQNIGECISGTNYDVATVRWGRGARMPTLEEVEELLDNCEWKTGYLNTVAGNYAIGPNDNSIFFPCAGWCGSTGVHDVGYNGLYWSGTHGDDYCDDTFVFGLIIGTRSKACRYSHWLHYQGVSVRPVSNK